MIGRRTWVEGRRLRPDGFSTSTRAVGGLGLKMKVNIADVSPVRKKIEVEIGAEKVSQEIEAFLRKLNKEVRIKGSRPGKVPLPLLKSRYRDYLEEEVSLKLIDDS